MITRQQLKDELLAARKALDEAETALQDMLRLTKAAQRREFTECLARYQRDLDVALAVFRRLQAAVE